MILHPVKSQILSYIKAKSLCILLSQRCGLPGKNYKTENRKEKGFYSVEILETKLYRKLERCHLLLKSNKNCFPGLRKSYQLNSIPDVSWSVSTKTKLIVRKNIFSLMIAFTRFKSIFSQNFAKKGKKLMGLYDD